MITGLSIENFRRFKKLKIDGIKRLTLISGKNNVGKTTVLEALFLLMDHATQQSFLKLNGYRGANLNNQDNLWKPLFTDMNIDSDIRIAVEKNGKLMSLVYRKDTEYLPLSIVGVPDVVVTQLRTATRSSYSLAFQFETEDYWEEGHFTTDGNNILADVKTNLERNEIRRLLPTRIVSATVMKVQDSIINDFGKLEVEGKKETVVNVLKKLDPSIDDVVTISLLGYPQLYIRTGDKLLPIQFAGDGVVKLLNVVIAIMVMQGGLVLFDELETGFHYSMHEKLWKIIDEVSQETNCQVIATTHSFELIKAAVGSIQKTDDFAYFRLGKGKEGIVAYRYDYGLLNSALKSELEVR